ncbi:MAG: hypothetical protein U1F47_09300 [Hyphomicrobiales bacterium]
MTPYDHRITEYRLGDGGQQGAIVLAAWAGLCAAWNVCGALQLAYGLRPLGPGTNLAAAAFLLLMAAAFLVSARRRPAFFLVLAAVGAVLAGLTIWNAFTLRALYWPSGFWRFVAVALNALGIGGAILAFGDAVRHVWSRRSFG